MQKLERRNTYTPTNIPHVRGNCDLSLNVEETLCVVGLKTLSNTSDAALTGLGDVPEQNLWVLAAKTISTYYTKNTTAGALILHLLMQRVTSSPSFQKGYPLPFEPTKR
jgi:hypothetical protein